MTGIERLKESAGISQDSLIVVLTGAGVSAESGVPTFRGENGLWKKFRPEELATPYAFMKDPKTVWEWYEYRRGIIIDKEPNPAHIAITNLEAAFERFHLITQNVDGLHLKAGTKKVIELHGNLFRARCTDCSRKYDPLEHPLKEIPPRCECGSLLRPDVVWFGEQIPPELLQQSFELSGNCDLMIVVGTSGVVQPAASMPLIAKQSGAYVVEINPETTPITPFSDLFLKGKAGDILPKVVTALVSS